MGARHLGAVPVAPQAYSRCPSRPRNRLRRRDGVTLRHSDRVRRRGVQDAGDRPVPGPGGRRHADAGPPRGRGSCARDAPYERPRDRQRRATMRPCKCIASCRRTACRPRPTVPLSRMAKRRARRDASSRYSPKEAVGSCPAPSEPAARFCQARRHRVEARLVRGTGVRIIVSDLAGCERSCYYGRTDRNCAHALPRTPFHSAPEWLPDAATELDRPWPEDGNAVFQLDGVPSCLGMWPRSAIRASHSLQRLRPNSDQVPSSVFRKAHIVPADAPSKGAPTAANRMARVPAEPQRRFCSRSVQQPRLGTSATGPKVSTRVERPSRPWVTELRRFLHTAY